MVQRWCPLLVLVPGLLAAPAAAETLLLLPVQGELDKISDLAAVNELFKEAVINSFQGEVKAPSDSAHQCGDKECALQLANAAKTDQVLFTVLRRLGGKWIFSSTRVDADGSDLFNQRGTALNLEDLEQVTRRVAEALVAGKTVEQAATIDNITLREETQEPVRRRSLYAGGISLGYLYPVGESYAWLEIDSTSRGVFRRVHSPVHMPRLAWVNTWEFRENLILDFDAVWYYPHSLGGDLSIQYLLSRADFAPFVGGGVGIHWVRGDDEAPETKTNTGPALNAQAGLILFRTYDIHVVARGQYHVVFNSDKDHGPGFDIGVVYQRKANERSSGWSSFWKFYLLGVLFVTVVSSLTEGSD